MTTAEEHNRNARAAATLNTVRFDTHMKGAAYLRSLIRTRKAHPDTYAGLEAAAGHLEILAKKEYK